MIAESEAQILKKTLGTRYSKAVLEILKEKAVTKENGSEFSIGFISHVLNGRYENLIIESAIYELVSRKQKSTKELLKRKKQAIKKPEAGTSGNF
jgi:hypothetical protein